MTSQFQTYLKLRIQQNSKEKKKKRVRKQKNNTDKNIETNKWYQIKNGFSKRDFARAPSLDD